jgi:hypothetical protein
MASPQKRVATKARAPALIRITIGNPHRPSRCGRETDRTRCDRLRRREHGNTGAGHFEAAATACRAIPRPGSRGTGRRPDEAMKKIGKRI